MARVLVIEDDALVRATLKQIIAAEGHEVIEAENGRKGIDLCRRSPADVIVTDILMPEVDGIEVILECRKIAPNVKILAVSGGGRTRNMDFLAYAKKVGADRILPKPFDTAQLRKTLRDLAPSDSWYLE